MVSIDALVYPDHPPSPLKLKYAPQFGQETPMMLWMSSTKSGGQTGVDKMLPPPFSKILQTSSR